MRDGFPAEFCFFEEEHSAENPEYMALLFYHMKHTLRKDVNKI